MRLGRDRYTTIKFALIAGTILAAGACSLLVDAERLQCNTARDCFGHGLDNAVCQNGVCQQGPKPVVDSSDEKDAPPVDPVWGCLDNRPVPPAEEPDVPVNFPLKFLLDQGGPVSVLACKDEDHDCATPLDASVGLMSDDGGSVKVPVYSGFKGFVKLDPDAGETVLYPTYIPVIPLPDKNIASPYTGVWPLFGKNVFPALAAASQGGDLKPEYGHLLFIALTCNYLRAPAMKVSIDKKVPQQTYGFYTDDNNVPSLTFDSTQKDGVGGFINLPEGEVKLTVSNERGVKVSEHSVFIRRSTLTLVSLDPN